MGNFKRLLILAAFGTALNHGALAASRTISFIGQAKSSLRTESSMLGTAPEAYVNPFNVNIPDYPTVVTVTCNIVITNVSVPNPPLVPAPVPAQVTAFTGSFRVAPLDRTGAQSTQHGFAPGGPGVFYYLFTSGGATNAAITQLAGLPSPNLGGWAQPNNSLMIQMRASFPLRGGVGNTGAGNRVAGRQANLPEFCVGTVTVIDPVANTSGSVIATGAIEYVANSDTNYQRTTQIGVEASAVIDAGASEAGGCSGGCRTASGTQVDFQMVEMSPQLYGLPHHILSSPFMIWGGQPF